MRQRLVKVEQLEREDGPVAVIFARGEDGSKNIFRKSGLDSYFYSATDPEKARGWAFQDRDKIKDISKEGKSIFGNELWKITTKLPRNTYNLRKGLVHFEADITWTQRAAIDLGIKDGFEYDKKSRTFTPCDAKDIPLRWWVVDVEVMNEPNEYPNWKKPDSSVCCIVVWDSYENKSWRFSMKDKTEKQMFRQFITLLWNKDPDIITGWNIFFDVSYIMGRMKKLHMDENSLSPMRRAYCYEKRDEGNKVIYEVVEVQGRIIFDSLEAYKIYKNPSGKKASYNLHEIAREELGIEWEDLGGRVKSAWEENPDDIIRYCLKDVTFERDIIQHNSLIDIFASVSAVSGCPMGNTNKKTQVVDNYLLRIRGDKILPSKKRDRNMRIKEDAKGTDEEFKGAIVLDPPSGIHKGVSVFDASGLYPSIMIGYNISPETKLTKEEAEPDDYRIEDDRGNVWYFKNKKKQVGLIPIICQDFKDLRKDSKALKEEMKNKYGPETPEWYLAHFRDAAIKSMMNSIYGVVGEPGFRLFDLDCANAITAVGRNTTVTLSDVLDKEGYASVYGDSVLGDTPIVIKENNQVKIIPIKNLIPESIINDKVKRYKINHLKVLTEKGFQKITYVYQHKVRKKCFRILTVGGYVECTEDHSLIIDGKKTKPSTLKIGDRLNLIDYSPKEKYNFDEDVSWLFGFFIAEGTCGYFNSKYGLKRFWRIVNQDKNYLEKCQRILKDKLGFDSKINDYRKSSSVYGLDVIGKKEIIIQYFRNICYSGKEKIVPSVILESREKSKNSFLKGLLDGDGHEDKQKTITLDQKHKSVICGVCQILDSLHIKYTLGNRTDKSNIIKIRIISNSQDKRLKEKNIIKKIEEFYVDDFVYDISTNSGTFCGGIGNIVLKNTDSVFVKTGSYENAMVAKEYIDGFIKNQLREWGVDEDAIEIGFEKFFKSILFKRKKVRKNVYVPVKKKYVGHMTYFEDKPCDELYIRGFETRRSDQASVLNRIMMDFFKNVFQKDDVEAAIQLVKDEKQKFSSYSPYEIAIPKAVHKYNESSPWVRGMEYAKEHLNFKFDVETAPRLLYLKRVGGSYPATDVVCIQRGHALPKEFEIDYDLMYEKIIRKKLELVMEELGFKWINVIDGVKKLDGWF